MPNMDPTWQAMAATSAAMGIGLLSLALLLDRSGLDPREPPLAKTSIPIIGHAIGIMRNSFNYYAQLSRNNPFPIFTIVMPGAKMYIVTSPALIQAVQKQPKKLAFPPIEAKFASRVCGSSPEAQEILMKNVNGDQGDWGLSMEAYAAIKDALAPGAELDAMNRIMVQNVASSLDDLEAAGTSTRVGLAQWLRTTITKATTNSVYGPQNPYRNEDVQNGFWDFEKDLMKILIGFGTSITASKGLAGRRKVVDAFVRYFENGGHREASILMQNRFTTSAKHGISIEDIASYEVGGSIAILVNTVPATFWMLVYVYSHPEILQEIRKEVAAVVVLQQPSPDEQCVNSLDITALKTNCPLLTSTFQEVLRHRSMGTSIRQVMEDTLLDGRWLLKKDSLVQIPSIVLHEDASIWGTDAHTFVPQRFLKDNKNKVEGRKRPNPAAFRAFGGGSTLCPGRHFATNEVLAFTSMLILRYDVTPTNGKWVLPTTYNTNAAAVVREPDTEIEVEISRVQNPMEGSWVFTINGSEKIFAMAAEDGA